MREQRTWRSGWLFTDAFRKRFIKAYADARMRESGYFTQSQYIEKLVELGLEREREQRRGA